MSTILDYREEMARVFVDTEVTMLGYSIMQDKRSLSCRRNECQDCHWPGCKCECHTRREDGDERKDPAVPNEPIKSMSAVAGKV